MRTFEHFPEGKICKLCGTGEDKKCTLVPIDGTEDGGNVEAEVVHIECIANMNLRYNPLHYVFYQVVDIITPLKKKVEENGDNLKKLKKDIKG